MLCATAGEWVGELEGDEYVDGWSVVVARAALRAAAGGRGRGTSVGDCECCWASTGQGIVAAQADRGHTRRYPQGSAGLVPAERAARRRTVRECEAIHRAGLAAAARGRRSAQIVHASARVHRCEGAGGHQYDARAGFGSRPESRDRHLDSRPSDPGGGRCRRSLRVVPTRPADLGYRGSHRIFQGQLAIGRGANVLKVSHAAEVTVADTSSRSARYSDRGVFRLGCAPPFSGVSPSSPSGSRRAPLATSAMRSS